MITLPRSFLLPALAFAVLPPLCVRGAELGDRLANLSTRAQVGTGANIMIAGFVVGEGAPKRVLVRAIGPALAAFSVAGTLNDPVLELFDGKGALLTTNDSWTTGDAAAMAGVGAFPLTAGSRDAALVATLAPGANSGPALAVLDDAGRSIATNDNGATANADGQLAAAFTASDFGRAFITHGDGSDHGWGSHHFAVGGAVRGGDIYGRMPEWAIDGPDDTGYGRWIPTSSVDEYSSTLATWFGVSPTNLPLVLPNIGRFAKPNLGFLG